MEDAAQQFNLIGERLRIVARVVNRIRARQFGGEDPLMPATRRKLIACWETLDTFARDWRTATQSTGAVASIEMYRASTAMEPGSENSLLPTPSSAIGCYE